MNSIFVNKVFQGYLTDFKYIDFRGLRRLLIEYHPLLLFVPLNEHVSLRDEVLNHFFFIKYQRVIIDGLISGGLLLNGCYLFQ